MITTFKNAHALCPNPACQCMISFPYGLLEADFAQIGDKTTYRYFGADTGKENIKCLYCNTTLMRGTVVSVYTVNPPGPVYREGVTVRK